MNIELTEDQAKRLYLLFSLIPISKINKVELSELITKYCKQFNNTLIHSVASSIGTKGLGLQYTLEQIVKNETRKERNSC